jgi:hypothetical protein
MISVEGSGEGDSSVAEEMVFTIQGIISSIDLPPILEKPS